jgi:Domain of unknown function (DUF4333)
MRKPVALALTLPLLAAPLLATGPASAAGNVKIGALERNIKTGFKQQARKSVTVKCPAKVTWVKGKIFYCKVMAKDGSRYRVRVKLGSEASGRANWKLV